MAKTQLRPNSNPFVQVHLSTLLAQSRRPKLSQSMPFSDPTARGRFFLCHAKSPQLIWSPGLLPPLACVKPGDTASCFLHVTNSSLRCTLHAQVASGKVSPDASSHSGPSSLTTCFNRRNLFSKLASSSTSRHPVFPARQLSPQAFITSHGPSQINVR